MLTTRPPCTCGFQPDGTFVRQCPACDHYRAQHTAAALQTSRDHTAAQAHLDDLCQQYDVARLDLWEKRQARDLYRSGAEHLRLSAQVHTAAQKVKRLETAITKQRRLLAEQEVVEEANHAPSSPKDAPTK